LDFRVIVVLPLVLPDDVVRSSRSLCPYSEMFQVIM
jgi:hypothetical protein